MSDLSVRNSNSSMQRMTDALLRTGGASVAILLMPTPPGDSSDAAQLGINVPQFQGLALAPALFRRTRPTMTENQPAKHELLISGTAVAQQISSLQLASADALFSMAAGVSFGGMALLIEEWASTVSLGEAVVYRLLVRVAETELPYAPS